MRPAERFDDPVAEKPEPDGDRRPLPGEAAPLLRSTIEEAAPPAAAPRLEWTPELAEQFWRAAYLHDLAPARVPRRTARHLAAVLAQRIPAAAQIVLLGERDGDYAAALLRAGFRVGRIDTGPLLRSSEARLATHPAWLGAAPAPRQADLVLVPECLAQIMDAELDALFAAARVALRPGGQLIVTVCNNETLDLALSLCPASGTLFHKDQRLRAFSPGTLRELLERQGFGVTALIEGQLDESGFLSLRPRREELATAERMYFGDGNTLLAFAALQDGARPDDCAKAARWPASRREVAAATPMPELADWIWTPATVADFWNRFAGTPLNAMSFGLTAGAALLEALEPWLMPDGRHLDIGAGEGEMARLMAQAGYAVAALEPSSGRRRMLAEKMHGAAGYLGAVEAIAGDLAGSFDVVMACEVVEHVLEEGLCEFFTTLDRALARGGRLLITTPNREDLDDSRMVSPAAGVLYHRWQHIRSFDPATLTALLARHRFSVEVVHEVDAWALASGASPGAALVVGGTEPVCFGNRSTLIAIAHRAGEEPLPPRDPLTIVSQIATGWRGGARLDGCKDGGDGMPHAGRSGLVRSVAAILTDQRVRRALRPLIRVVRPVARRVVPLALKPHLVRLITASEAGQQESMARRFSERPVMLRDLPPLLGPEVFADGPIILLNNSLAYGGAERQLVTTLRGLDGRAGHPLGLLCMRLGDGLEYDFFRPALNGFAGIVRNAVDLAPARRLVAAAAPRQAVARARAAIDWLPNDVQDDIERLAGDFVQLRPAVVHAWQDSLSIATAYAARIVGVPRVIVSGRNLSPRNFTYYRPYMVDAYSEVASIPEIIMLNNSAAGAADYARWLGLPGNRIEVLRNGVDPAASAPPPAGTRERLRATLRIPETAPVVGSIFRFYEEKRPLLWAEVAALIGRARPDCHFVVVGAGPLHGEVLKRARDDGIADRLHCPGPSSETAAYLSLFDVFLLTSRAEGTPNVVLEASLAGVPVVATAGGGSAEAVDEGASGVVVWDNSAAAIAARVIEVLDDPTWSERARAAGPAFVRERYGRERMLDETLALYRR